MELYAHQQAIVDLFPKRHLLAWQVRSGKSLANIALANKAGSEALFIVPKQLFKQWDTLLAEHSTVRYLLLTKEQFRAQAKALKRFNTVSVDEAHHFSGMQSEMSKQLERYLKRHNPEHVYFLTGTPFRSTPWNIYRLATLLGHKWNYMEFRRQFFYERYLGRGVVYMPKPDCQDELADLVRSIGSIVRLEDCTDMPSDPNPVVETLPMSKQQQVLLNTVNERESNPLVRFGKYHQVASGFLIGNEFIGDMAAENAKEDRIVELIQENDRALVFAKYNLQIALIAKRLEKEGIPYVVINGATKDVEAAREEVRSMKYGAALISMGCSEGYSFAEYSCTIYASLSYSFLDFEQSQGRTKHIEKRVPNFYVILNTEGSADIPVYEAISNKQSFSEAIYVRQHMV